MNKVERILSKVRVMASMLFFISGTYANNLDQLARQCNTDKSSLAHNYTKIYEKHFKKLQNKPLKILEIGFLTGCSARLWDKYFTNSLTRLFFLDINPELQKYAKGLSSRCSLHIVNQDSENELHDFIKKNGDNFDIIIDDGGHTMTQQITSFKTLFPFLKKGGLYIIEDLHTSYWKTFGSAGEVGNPIASENATINFLRNLVHDVNFIGAFTGYGDRARWTREIPTLTEYQKHIESIHFYTSVCVIVKD